MPDGVSRNCDFSLLDDATAMTRVRHAVEAREPFSMIRLNDGEAVVMSFDDDMWLNDVAYLQSHWGAEGVPLGAAAQVRHDLEEAIEHADLVGIRDDVVGVSVPDDLLERRGPELLDIVRTAFPLRPHERDGLSVGGARRIALLHRALSRIEWNHQELCSCWIHWELLASGVLHDLLQGIDHVGLVTARPELEHLVERRFDVVASTVLVPDKFVEAHRSGAHVPRRYRTIRDELVFPPGTLVLVGAGIPGKVYCHWLKQAGCVAIDVGAVFDAWVGKASRPRVLESRFAVRGGASVPPELQLVSQAQPADRVLVPRWKPERSAP